MRQGTNDPHKCASYLLVKWAWKKETSGNKRELFV